MHEDNSKRQDTTSNKDLSDKNTERQGILTLNNLADNGDENFELEKEYKGKENNMVLVISQQVYQLTLLNNLVLS